MSEAEHCCQDPLRDKLNRLANQGMQAAVETKRKRDDPTIGISEWLQADFDFQLLREKYEVLLKELETEETALGPPWRNEGE